MVVWVRFPKLPYQYYHKDILVGLGNLIGRFVCIDKPTLNSARGKFARIAVEINIAEPVATGVSLDGVWQEVEYENLPSFCFKCGLLGHEVSGCPHIVSPVIAGNSSVAGASSPNIPVGKEEEHRSGFRSWLTVQRKVRGTKKVSPSPAISGVDYIDIKKGKSKILASHPKNRVKMVVGNALSSATNQGKKSKKE
ncbi:hypothetical protein LINGRAHAP2_LOCUS23703 [Linum grandiflorum]